METSTALLKSLKLLIVSDTAYQRSLVADLARSVGVGSVQTADDAVTAFAALRFAAPHVLLVDADMRPYSGLQLTAELRQGDKKTRALPVILYTDENSRAFAEQAANVGVSEVLTKPLSHNDLVRCLIDAVVEPSDRGTLVERMLDRKGAHGHGPALQRAHWETPAPNTDRAARAALAAALEAAQVEAGGIELLDEARDTTLAALREAEALAGQDLALKRLLAAACKLCALDPPPRGPILAAIAGARAMHADPLRTAMREALAASVVDLANRRAKASAFVAPGSS